MKRRLLLVLALMVALGAAAVMLVWLDRPDPVLRSDVAAPTPQVYFGGPDKPARALRDLLEARIDAVPPGGWIDWATYYFRDRRLAAALIAASHRGVRVRLCVEGDPRRADANLAVLAMLQADGLKGGFCVHRDTSIIRRLLGEQHAKIYAFSHPRPVAFVGSFNPSGDTATSAALTAEIGDQDRGHNLLVELTSPPLVAALRAQVGRMETNDGWTNRFSAQQNRIVADRDTRIFFYPRLHPNVIDDDLDRLAAGDHLYGAISHLKGELAQDLTEVAQRGAKVNLIVHESRRRVPDAVVAEIAAAGGEIRRYDRADDIPMHAKFVLLQRGAERIAYFGSFNFNRNSTYLNDEVLVRSTDPGLFATLLARFEAIGREVDHQPRSPSDP
jgi:phosphatidylserine/phosphatidylglycerophosphate/cardiolipin synthase-like enzyme